jgi:hypothetical protein
LLGTSTGRRTGSLGRILPWVRIRSPRRRRTTTAALRSRRPSRLW